MSTNATYKINYDKLGKLIIPALFATDQIPTYRPLFRSQIFRRWNLEKCKNDPKFGVKLGVKVTPKRGLSRTYNFYFTFGVIITP